MLGHLGPSACGGGGREGRANLVAPGPGGGRPPEEEERRWGCGSSEGLTGEGELAMGGRA